jgi:Beta-lactamase class C and other penicillin binding proteins
MPTRSLVPVLVLAALGAPHSVDAQKPRGFDAAWSGVHGRLRFDTPGAPNGWRDPLVPPGRPGAGARELRPRRGASGRAVTDSTIFHWASITKTLTAIGIMQLRDRGKLSLDDPIVKYVPELRQVHDSFGDVGEITIRQLMSHSAGFRNGTWPWSGDKAWYPFEPTKWSQLVAMMPYTEILFRPGSRYGYSNPGIIYLGQVIERLTGDDYEVYVTKNILMPLGMTHSYFDVTPYHLLRNRSNGYEVQDGKATAVGLDFDTGITTSNSGSTPRSPTWPLPRVPRGAPGHEAVYDGVLKRPRSRRCGGPSCRPAAPTRETP